MQVGVNTFGVVTPKAAGTCMPNDQLSQLITRYLPPDDVTFVLLKSAEKANKHVHHLTDSPFICKYC